MEDKGSFRASRSIPSEPEEASVASVPMLERMARAIAKANGDNPEYVSWTDYEALARSALLAIREIGPETMLTVQWGRVPERIQAYWSDVIDAILQGKA